MNLYMVQKITLNEDGHIFKIEWMAPLYRTLDDAMQSCPASTDIESYYICVMTCSKTYDCRGQWI